MGGIKIYTSQNIERLGVKLATSSTSQIYAAMPGDSIAFFYFETNSAMATEFGINNGGAVLLYKYSGWRGLGYASLVGDSKPIRFGNIATAENTFRWNKATIE